MSIVVYICIFKQEYEMLSEILISTSPFLESSVCRITKSKKKPALDSS